MNVQCNEEDKKYSKSDNFQLESSIPLKDNFSSSAKY